MAPVLKVKRLTKTAKMPEYKTPLAACFDISIDPGSPITPHENDPNAVKVGTGLAFEIDPGKALLLFSRSGHGFKDGIRLSNCVGVIDADYRDEVKVSLRCDGTNFRQLEVGERVVQGLIVAAEQVQFLEMDELSETARKGGFGSTGRS